MADWRSLRHAYGAADDIPGLLQAAEAAEGELGPAWDEVWSRLYHQGTVYSASFAAIPRLAGIAERRASAGYIAALDLVAAIVASNDAPPGSETARTTYAAELSRLRDLAERNLALASSDAEFSYGLQALMAFEDGGVWQRHLDHLADGELPLECPSCGESLLIGLDGDKHRVRSFSDGSVAPTEVEQSEPAAQTAEGRLLALSRSHGRSDVAARLPYLFGRATCPHCGAAFEIPSALS